MSRTLRIQSADVPMHLVQRGNNRQRCFFKDGDFFIYHRWLGEYGQSTGCAIHAYVLMDNHIHLLLTPSTNDAASQLMKALNQRYAHYINRRYSRTGGLWEGRFRSCVIDDERYMLACHRYIEMNPVRAGMVQAPGDYVWSSYRANGNGLPDVVLTPSSTYVGLHTSDAQRREAYRRFFLNKDSERRNDLIRYATFRNRMVSSLTGEKQGQTGRPTDRNAVSDLQSGATSTNQAARAGTPSNWAG